MVLIMVFYLQATRLLTVMSWNTESADCFQCLVNIMNILLRQPLNKTNEGIGWLYVLQLIPL